MNIYDDGVSYKLNTPVSYYECTPVFSRAAGSSRWDLSPTQMSLHVHSHPKYHTEYEDNDWDSVLPLVL